MIPQELIERGLKVGISKEELEDLYNNGFNPDFMVRTAERAKKSIESRKSSLTPAPIKTTLIGNGFEVECPKIVGTNLADNLVSHKIEVYEIRFPFNKSHALIYGKLNPEVDIEEVVNTYCKEHGY